MTSVSSPAIAPRPPIAPASPSNPAPGVPVNDIHAQLSGTTVARVEQVRSAEDVQRVVAEAKASGQSIAIAGGRHSMGGQQFLTDGILIDSREMNDVLAFDPEAGTVTVEAGIQWPKLIEYLSKEPANSVAGPQGYNWSIRQKQTGADRLSIGGAISSNIHGRGLTLKPFIDDIESMQIVDAEGVKRTVSREQDPDTFTRVAGGYGMFGVITAATLRLQPRQQLKRNVEVIGVDQLMDKIDQRISDGHRYGDFQFAIDSKSPDFLQRGVLSTYSPVDNTTPIPGGQKKLSPDDWGKLLYLAHVDKDKAFGMYAGHYQSTDGQRYWSDTHQSSTYADNYHEALDKATGAAVKGTEMISELYVPRDQLAGFLKDAAQGLRELDANVVYGTVRLIEEDTESQLPWAREPWAAVVMNLHADHTEEGVAKVQKQFRHLIDLANARDGSYYLTYHKWATPDQVEKAHPRIREFLAEKLDHDPQERFQSDWYRQLRDQFSGTSA